MTNLVLTALIWWQTNYIDSGVDARGDGMFRTNIITRFYAVPIPDVGWATNAVARTNISLMKLRWVEISNWSEPTNAMPPLPK